MHRTSLFLDERLIQQLQKLAKTRQVSVASLVREAVALYVAAPSPGRTALPSIAGQFASGTSDTSERIDELLWTEPHE